MWMRDAQEIMHPPIHQCMRDQLLPRLMTQPVHAAAKHGCRLTALTDAAAVSQTRADIGEPVMSHSLKSGDDIWWELMSPLPALLEQYGRLFESGKEKAK